MSRVLRSSAFNWSAPLSFVLLLASCASISNEYVATPVDESGRRLPGKATRSGLIVSGEERTEYASRFFGMVEITFENTSAHWLRVRQVALGFDPRMTVTLPEGSDLDAWYLATVQRNDIRDTNAAAALGGLVLVGGIVAGAGAASGEPELAAGGAALALGASVAQATDTYGDVIRSVEQARRLPDNHLLTVPFAIPPGLFAKKWVLLNPGPHTPCVRVMRIDYDIEGQGRERVVLSFRSLRGSSTWQSKQCRSG